MKLTLILILLNVCVAFSSTYSQQTKFTLSGENVSIRDVLSNIESKSEFRFFFNNELINMNQRVNYRIEEGTIFQLLDQVLLQNGIQYEVKDRTIILSPKSSNEPGIAAQQQRSISGKVTDASGAPLPGVSVIIKGSTQGTVTDTNGKYSLRSVPDNSMLLFSFVGMKAQEIAVAGKNNINIEMEEETVGLEEVVAIGYGTQSKELLTTSVSKVDTIAFKNIPYSNAAHALQGTLPGVRVISTSGRPGAAPLIILRGGTSLDPNSSSPLYIIDGVISPDMAGLNSHEIESIQMLKDAASTAIYGARGSNGVVIITTKSGKAGKMRLIYNYDLSFSKYKMTMDMLNAEEYIYFNRLAIKAGIPIVPAFEGILSSATSAGTGNDLTKNTLYTTQYLTPDNEHKLNEGWKSMKDPLDPAKTIIFQDTDWRDVVFRTAISHNHNITASGGTDKGTYSASLGYLNNEGIAIRTGYERLTFSTKGDLKLTNNLTVSSNISYTLNTTKGVFNESTIFGRIIQIPPTTKYKFEDGTLAWGQNGNRSNPEYLLSKVPQSSSSERSNFSLGAKWDISSDLSFTSKVSLLSMVNNFRSFTMALHDGNNYNETRNASETLNRYYSRQAESYFDYDKKLDNHNIKLMAGVSFLETEENHFNAAGRGAATDHIQTLNASAVPESVYAGDLFYRYVGYFSRLSYDFRQKYLASINARYDGASNLGANYRWGFFPGVSLGWNMHRENFMGRFASILSKSKLRVSYGENGNTNALGPYLSQGSYGVGGRYADVGTILNTVLENPELKWEEARTFDVGADLEFFGNLFVTFDYYRRVTNNLVSNRTLPHETGFGSITTNLGSVENKGFEFELGIQPVSNRVFNWHFSVNGAYVKNKILKLPPNGIENNRIGGIYIWDKDLNNYAWKGGLQEGGTMGELYGYRQLGLYHSDEEAKSAPRDMVMDSPNKDKKYGGDVIWYDSDENNLIDERDRVYMGNTYPKWTGGLINSFSYKNLSLIIRADYMLGHTIYNYMRATTTGQFSGELGLSEYAGKSWLKPGDEMTTNIPRLYYGDYQSNLGRGNSIMFEKGNYMAIREITLSYDIPSNILHKMPFSHLRLNVTGHNLYYLTNFKGINPESGQDTYPISSDIIFSATITL